MYSVFPITFQSNWYVTCYIFFYLTHTKLNEIIRGFRKREFLTACVVMLFVYFGVTYVLQSFLFNTNLVSFIVAYFIVAYVKLYLPRLCGDVRVLLAALALGVLGTPFMIFLNNILGARFAFIRDGVELTHWAANSSPFCLLTALALFCLFRKKRFVARAVNEVSSCLLLVYLIHENVILRAYERPAMWSYIHETAGYAHIFFWVFATSAVIFISSLAVAYLYRLFLQHAVRKIAEKTFSRIASLFELFISALMKLD